MYNVMGILNLAESNDQLKSIATHRPVATIPFGGRYRLVDFILSSMVNSGIGNIGIFTCDKVTSVMDHLRSGKEWGLARARDGLFIFPSAAPPSDSRYWAQQLDFIKKSNQEYALISGGNMVLNIDFRAAFFQHKQNNADVTVFYQKHNSDICPDDGLTGIRITRNGRLVYGENSGAGRDLMGIYILSKPALIELVNECLAGGKQRLFSDGLAPYVGKRKIFGYQHTGYAARIHSIQSYYRHSMDLLKPNIWQTLFFQPGLIYTKTKDEGPVKYSSGAMVQASLIASGCSIEGVVENSILFRGVKVRRGACIKNSIIMQQSEIGENAVAEYVICDKQVYIPKDKKLYGQSVNPLVIEKGTVM